MTETTFGALGLRAPLLAALDARGHSTPTPIQAQAIPPLLAGRDLMGVAQTGTGKTGAFALPVLDALLADGRRRPKAPRALILAPTRELAAQIGAELAAYAKGTGLNHTVIFGGVGQGPQAKALARGVDVLVATPGRLLDLMQQARVILSNVETLVLDEADRMLDMGFVRDVRKIAAATPKARRTVMFSATMPREIESLAAELLHAPERVEVTPQSTTVERIRQEIRFVEAAEKPEALAALLDEPGWERVIVFSRTKHGADRIAKRLVKDGVQAEAIHGNKTQGARVRALEAFRRGEARVLVATDIAARGIDVSGVSHVVNFDLPVEPESYVHRIGRTARAGAEGAAVSLCAPAEMSALRAIERAIGMRLAPEGMGPAEAPAGRGRGRGGRRGAGPVASRAQGGVEGAAGGAGAPARPARRPGRDAETRATGEGRTMGEAAARKPGRRGEAPVGGEAPPRRPAGEAEAPKRNRRRRPRRRGGAETVAAE